LGIWERPDSTTEENIDRWKLWTCIDIDWGVTNVLNLAADFRVALGELALVSKISGIDGRASRGWNIG
jgi:hypothetical protein